MRAVFFWRRKKKHLWATDLTPSRCFSGIYRCVTWCVHLSFGSCNSPIHKSGLKALKRAFFGGGGVKREVETSINPVAAAAPLPLFCSVLVQLLPAKHAPKTFRTQLATVDIPPQKSVGTKHGAKREWSRIRMTRPLGGKKNKMLLVTKPPYGPSSAQPPPIATLRPPDPPPLALRPKYEK